MSLLVVESGRNISIQDGHFPNFQSGIDNAKSSSPGVGDTHYATNTKYTYVCYVTGTWTLVSALKLGNFTYDTSIATGTLAITGVGFKPKSVTFYANVPTTSQVSIGTDTYVDAVNTYNEHAVTPGTWNTWNGYSIVLMQAAGIYSRGYISSMDADGFTIQWTKTGAKVGTALILCVISV